MSSSDPHQIIRKHLGRFFNGHKVTEHQWTLGPAVDVYPSLRVLEFAPGPKSKLWIYVSVGAWEAQEEPRLEFFITALQSDLRHVELVSMVVWYHGEYRLGCSHTLPMGDPWLKGSTCDSFLVSLPYSFGPELELCKLPDGDVQILWLLPITAAERAFKKEHGVEAIEELFDAHAIKYWDPQRPSVV